jgi:predicted nucleic acid-binding protein
MEPERVRQFMDLLFQYVETVPASEFYPHIEEAGNAIGDTDPHDVLYVACALARDVAYGATIRTSTSKITCRCSRPAK